MAGTPVAGEVPWLWTRVAQPGGPWWWLPRAGQPGCAAGGWAGLYSTPCTQSALERLVTLARARQCTWPGAV